MNKSRWLMLLGVILLSLFVVGLAVASDTNQGNNPDSLWPGPDGFGYTGELTTFNWVDITTSGTIIPGLTDDNFMGPFPIGFSFTYYGETYTDFYTASNGYLTLGSGNSTFTNQCPLPNSSTPNNVIAMLWDDLNFTISGSAYYQYFASCPVGTGACTVVEYFNTAHYGGAAGSGGTWESIFYTNGNLLFQYLDAGTEEGSGSTSGIENNNFASDYGLTFACDTAASVTDGTALQFVAPPPAAVPDIDVSPTSLSANQPADTQTTQNLQICNVGEGDLTWEIEETPLMKVSGVTQPPQSQPSHPVELRLEANGISSPKTEAPVTPDAEVQLILDDGSRDNDIGLGGTIEMLWVNRFTPNPADFPFQLNEVWIYFSSVGLVNVGDDIVLVVYENTSGNYDPAVGSNFLASFPTTIQALDTWNVYTLPTPVTFNGPGDAIIGAIALELPGTSYWPASMDQTATQSRSWAGWWNSSPPPTPPLLPPENWTLIDAYFPGNWMVRGFGETGAAAEIPWLSENPTSGTVPPGSCTDVTVTFDSTGLAPGSYFGELDVASNDPDEPEVVVPVDLTVTGGLTSAILLVDDDQGDPNVESYYTESLDALGLSYTIWDTLVSGEPTAADLVPYDTVIWFTAHTYTAGPHPGAGEDALAEWLGGGGGGGDSIVGDWNLGFDWGCTGFPWVIAWSFYDDGTFSNEFAETGTWTQDGDQVDWVFDDPTRADFWYGTITGDYMEGNMEDPTPPGYFGCWSANRVVRQTLPGIIDGSSAAVSRQDPSANPHGQWLYKDEAGVMVTANNGGQVLAHPAAYRWTSSNPDALNVLIYSDDYYHVAPFTFPDQALQALGMSYTAYYEGDFAGFEAALAGGGWDLVVFDNENYGPTESTFTALNGYVQAGGKLVFTSWGVGSYFYNSLFTTLGITYMGDDYGPANVYWWDETHPFFTDPNSVPEYTSLIGGRYGIYGQYVEPMPGFVGLAGYTTDPAANQAAMVYGNDGRTVFKGFTDGANDADLDADGMQDGVELWINIISELGTGGGGGAHEPCLLLSSQDYLFENGLTPFGSQYLGIASYTSDVGQSVVTGAGSVYTGLGPYTLTYPFYNWADRVSPDATAELAFAGDMGDAAIDKFGATYFTTFAAYPLETIANVADRAAVLSTFITSCGGGVVLEPDIQVTPTELYQFLPPDATATQQLEVCNVGTGTLDWQLAEVPGLLGAMTSVGPQSLESIPSGVVASAVNQPANKTKDLSIKFTKPDLPNEILLDQAPNAVNGLFSDAGCEFAYCGTGAQSIADNFALEADATLTQIVFWTGYFPGDVPIDPDAIRVIFHQDAGGIPGAVVYDESNVSYTRVQTGVVLFGVHEWMHTLTLGTPVALSPGNYWVELFNNTGYGNDNFFWETGNPDTLGRGQVGSAFAFETPGVSWNFDGSGFPNLALQLVGSTSAFDIPWLTETPTAGSLLPGECSFVDVTFDSAGLTPGLYTGALDITSNDPDEPVVNVPVTLEVGGAPVIVVTPPEIFHTQPVGTIESEPLSIGNDGLLTLTWDITEDEAVSFVPQALINDGSFEFGPPPGSAWTEVSDQPCEWIGDWFSVWGVGAYDGSFDYWAGGYCGGIITSSNVSQLVSVPAGGVSLSFWYISYRPDPDDGGDDYAYINVDGTQVWSLPLNQANDTYPNFVNATVDLSAYAGSDVVLQFGAVSAGASTGNIRFDYIEFISTGPVACGSPSDIPWLSAVPDSGSTEAGEVSISDIFFDSTALTPGTYNADLCVNSNDPVTPLVVVPVELTVTETVAEPDIVVTPLALELTLYPNETGLLPFTIGNVGDANLTWSLVDSAAWLTEAPTSGTVAPEGETTVNVTFNSAGLAVGTYTGTITITSNDPDEPTITINVTLHVVARTFFLPFILKYP